MIYRRTMLYICEGRQRLLMLSHGLSRCWLPLKNKKWVLSEAKKLAETEGAPRIFMHQDLTPK